MEIKKVTVCGAGVMGATIAAQLANAGIEVRLLDLKKEDSDKALQSMMKMKPAPFMHPRNAKLIETGSYDQNMKDISDSDWILEVIVENPDIKSGLFKKIDASRKPGSIVSSNTSTIPLQKLVEGQSEQFEKDFTITHFFNPPRYMRLLELVSSNKTNPDIVKTLEQVCDEKLGKAVVHCKDTPGFIANRIGTFWLQAALNEAIDQKIPVEDADAAHKAFGFPKTGAFALMDMVGIDLMPHISESLLSSLPKDDGYSKIFKDYDFVTKMIEEGFTGRKGKGGFYRLNTEGGKKVKEAKDLSTGEYSAAKKSKLKFLKTAKKNLAKGLMKKEPAAQYAKSVMLQTLQYAASLIPEIADDIMAVDEAMKTGYGWKHGPFELIDKMDTKWFVKQLEKEGMDVPDILVKANGRKLYKTINGQLNYMSMTGDYEAVKRPDGVLLLSDIKRGSKPLASNKSASIWDIGDGVICLEFTSKMNTMNPLIMRMVRKSIDMVENSNGKYKAMVIHNEGENFSVGANIGLSMMAAKVKLWPLVNKVVKDGQETYKALKFSKFPVIGAPAGMALGGGAEILLHCDSIQPHAETYIGLVEGGVGLIPAWGGCKELLLRAMADKKTPKGPMPAVVKTFETISFAKVGMSAEESRSLLFLRDGDKVTMNKDRLLADAKQKALNLAPNYQPPKPITDIELPGPAGKAAADMGVNGAYTAGHATWYDVIVNEHLAHVLTGGKNADVGVKFTEDDILDLERNLFMDIAKNKQTLKRIENMVYKGKPLREKPLDPKPSAAEMRKKYPIADKAIDVKPSGSDMVVEKKPGTAPKSESKPSPQSLDNEPSLGVEFKMAHGFLVQKLEEISPNKFFAEQKKSKLDSKEIGVAQNFNEAARREIEDYQTMLSKSLNSILSEMPEDAVKGTILQSIEEKQKSLRSKSNDPHAEAIRQGRVAGLNWVKKKLG